MFQHILHEVQNFEIEWIEMSHPELAVPPVTLNL